MELWTARSKIASLQPTQQRTAILPAVITDRQDVAETDSSTLAGIRGLGAVYRDDGSGDYDIDLPSNATYDFQMIRQVIGFVDWMANAGNGGTTDSDVRTDQPLIDDSIPEAKSTSPAGERPPRVRGSHRGESDLGALSRIEPEDRRYASWGVRRVISGRCERSL